MSNQNFSTTSLLKLVLDIEQKYPNCHKNKCFNLNKLEDIINDSQAFNRKQRRILWLKYEQNVSNNDIAQEFNMDIKDLEKEIEVILLILNIMSPEYRKMKESITISKETYIKF